MTWYVVVIIGIVVALAAIEFVPAIIAHLLHRSAQRHGLDDRIRPGRRSGTWRTRRIG
jgi:uncharacterized membrane protein YdfJ with MMPL/SSD domain